MSSKPSPTAAEELVNLAREHLDLSRKEQELIEVERRLKRVQERKAEIESQITRKLKDIDCDAPGNFGWEGRFGWLVRAIVRIADRHPRGADASVTAERRTE